MESSLCINYYNGISSLYVLIDLTSHKIKQLFFFHVPVYIEVPFSFSDTDLFPFLITSKNVSNLMTSSFQFLFIDILNRNSYFFLLRLFSYILNINDLRHFVFLPSSLLQYIISVLVLDMLSILHPNV